MFPFVIRANFISRILQGRFCRSSICQDSFPFPRRKQFILGMCFPTHCNYFSSKSMKVAVLGAASKTGRCLSLFLKQSPLIDELAIYDNECTYGLALDLNYIDTGCKVSTCNPSESCLKQTLEGAKIVMIVGDRTIGKELNPCEILKCNADTLSDLLPNVIRFCPQALVAVAMNPINSLIPLAMEMYKTAGVYEYSRVFGVISLDCLRANTFAAEAIGIEPECVTVPVIGGSCSKTCIPIFSQAKPCNKISLDEARRLTNAVRTTDEEIAKANKDKDTPSFAMAFGAARFCVSLCKALRHQRGVVECAYARSCVIPEITYLAAPLELGPDGIQRHLGIPPLKDYECKLLAAAVPVLKRDISLGVTLALGHENIPSEANCTNSSYVSQSPP
ncbi:malate dehydrogenase, mitochondrial-like [Hylaeus volcanicus]|uniref:malate dehydrogenase, mitochondrial-like n=1 Tax=Hylaeus volcanicus TaxID=313075 RepID=UPI0023B7A3BD|nr:malate dehydrogenase, mitochondrial-like [Hylaeus volcanicus]